MSQEKRPFSVSEHPPARTRPAARTAVSQHARVCSRPATEKEGGSTVRRTEKSDWAASLAPAEIKVRAGAVLPGSGSAEHKAASAIPQPAEHAAPSHYLDKKEEMLGSTPLTPKGSPQAQIFQHPRLISSIRIAANNAVAKTQIACRVIHRRFAGVDTLSAHSYGNAGAAA